MDNKHNCSNQRWNTRRLRAVWYGDWNLTLYFPKGMHVSGPAWYLVQTALFKQGRRLLASNQTEMCTDFAYVCVQPARRVGLRKAQKEFLRQCFLITVYISTCAYKNDFLKLINIILSDRDLKSHDSPAQTTYVLWD